MFSPPNTMPSLYQTLLSQYPEKLAPVRCTEQTVMQLHRYFEGTILEHKLYGLLIEGLPLARQRSLREVMRLREISHEIQHGFLFVHEDDELCQQFPSHGEWNNHEFWLLKHQSQRKLQEHFLLLADERFSALMATAPRSVIHGEDDDEEDEAGAELIWTFEPEIICTALEYLVKQVETKHIKQSPAFSQAICQRYPQVAPMPLTVTVASRLAQLLQEQAGREIAVNRIATAIRKSLELESILQTTVEEVGRALKAEFCALRVVGEGDQPPLTHYSFRDGLPVSDDVADELRADLDAYSSRLSKHRKSYMRDGQEGQQGNAEALPPLAVVTLRYHEGSVGVLMVRLADVTRVWQESETLLLRTVADQVAVAVNHARLFEQVQQQALTDGLTGCHNRRAFEGQLERDLHMATRLGQPLSLVLLDLDKFKHVNDTYGHDTGDLVLRILAQTLREELRRVDTAARIGGEEFAIILPQSDMFGALAVAERLRLRIEKLQVPKVGHITASFGVSVFPFHGAHRAQLASLADRALYLAKQTGRNRICLPPDEEIIVETEEMVMAREEMLAEVA
jgi:diguanylate cyclase (GGDEF)-like protein